MVKKIEAFQADDGKIFESLTDANEHNEKIIARTALEILLRKINIVNSAKIPATAQKILNHKSEFLKALGVE
jgi:hypothetical protein